MFFWKTKKAAENDTISEKQNLINNIKSYEKELNYEEQLAIIQSEMINSQLSSNQDREDYILGRRSGFNSKTSQWHRKSYKYPPKRKMNLKERKQYKQEKLKLRRIKHYYSLLRKVVNKKQKKMKRLNLRLTREKNELLKVEQIEEREMAFEQKKMDAEKQLVATKNEHQKSLQQRAEDNERERKIRAHAIKIQQNKLEQLRLEKEIEALRAEESKKSGDQISEMLKTIKELDA